jgi:hypothetical protein
VSVLVAWMAGYQARPPQRPTNCDLAANHNVCHGAFAYVTFALGCLLIALVVGAFLYFRWERRRRPVEGAERLRRKLQRRRLLRWVRAR